MENFIVLDIETGGLLPHKHGLLSIGAVDYNTGQEFYIESRADNTDQLDPYALAINGFTIEQALDQSKPTGKEACQIFVKWAALRNTNILAGQQIGSFDIPFLYYYAGGKLEFEKVFSKRSIDLHSLAFGQFKKSLSLDGILKEFGLEPEPKPHNALTGARLERDAFKKLLEISGWKS